MKSDLNIINDGEKIVNLLTMLLKTKGNTFLRNNLVEYNGTIDEILDDRFIFVMDYKIPLEKSVRIFFNYLDKLYYFTSDVIEVQNKKIFLRIPKEVIIRVKRKTKRYNVKKFGITCDLRLISSAMNKGVSRQVKYAGMNLEPVYRELEEERPDLVKIITLINNHKNDIFDSLKIIMPLDKLSNTIVANFIKAYNRPFLINNAQAEQSYASNPLPDIVLSYSDYFSLVKKAVKSEVDVPRTIRAVLEQFKKASVYAILYMPILILGRTVGVLEIVNTTASSRDFGRNGIDYFMNVAAILSEAIIKNKLNTLEEAKLNISVLDLSLSGIGIEVDDPILLNYLALGARLKVTLDLGGGKDLFFIGTVRNSQKSGAKTKIGIGMDEVQPNDRTRIVNFINRNFVKDYESVG